MTQSVCRADKHNGRKLQVLLLNSSSPGDVVVVHPALQPNGTTHSSPSLPFLPHMPPFLSAQNFCSFAGKCFPRLISEAQAQTDARQPRLTIRSPITYYISELFLDFFFSLCLPLGFSEPTVCGNTGKVCPNKCVIDLTSQTPGFHCAPPEREGEAQEIPAISRTVPPSTLSDPLFAGILSLVGKNFP